MRSHNDEKPFTCKWPGCNKGFARQHDCKRHEQLHSNHRPFTCEGCRKPFARLDALNRHRTLLYPTTVPVEMLIHIQSSLREVLDASRPTSRRKPRKEERLTEYRLRLRMTLPIGRSATSAAVCSYNPMRAFGLTACRFDIFIRARASVSSGSPVPCLCYHTCSATPYTPDLG